VPAICEASLTRKFNLGNYESIEVGLKAFIGEGENPQQVLAELEYHIQRYIQTSHPEATPQTLPQQPQRVEKLQTADDVKKKFPEDLEGFLNFEDKGEYIKITPRQYLGAENFAKAAEIVRKIGGDYVSAGKDSHFRVPKVKP
jgi:hypothetical protein